MQDFQIKIGTTADTSGAKATEHALQGVGKAARDVTRETKAQGSAAGDAAKNVSSLGETTEKGIGIGRIFAEVARGNFLALLNLSAALKGLGAAMKTNVVGILLLAVTALGNFLLALRGTKKEAEEAEPSFDGLAASVAKLNQVKLEGLRAELAALAEQGRAAAEFFDKIQGATAKIDKAREALEIAQIEANQELTPEQKKAAVYEVRQRFAGQSRAREAEADQARIYRAQQEAEEKARIALEADNVRRGVAGRLDTTISRRADLNRAMGELNKQFGQALTASAGDQGKALAASEAYRAVAGPIAERQAQAFGPAADARLKALQDELRGAEERARLAQEAADRAQKDLLQARGDASLNQTTRAMVSGLEARTARVQAGLPEPVSRISSTSEIIGGLTSVRGLNGEEVGNRIADLVQQKMREGEEALVRAVERRLQENQRIQEQQAKALRR